MNNEEKILEMLGGLLAKFEALDGRFDRVENEVQTTKNIAARIEHDHGQKLNALFDGYVLLHEISVEVRDEIVGIKDEQVQQDVQLTFFKHQKKA